MTQSQAPTGEGCARTMLPSPISKSRTSADSKCRLSNVECRDWKPGLLVFMSLEVMGVHRLFRIGGYALFVFRNDVRSDEDYQFFLFLVSECAGEKLAEARNIAEPRHLFIISRMLGLDQAADDDGCGVMHAHQRRGLFGVQDGRGRSMTGRGYGGFQAGEHG